MKLAIQRCGLQDFCKIVDLLTRQSQRDNGNYEQIIEWPINTELYLFPKPEVVLYWVKITGTHFRALVRTVEDLWWNVDWEAGHSIY